MNTITRIAYPPNPSSPERWSISVILMWLIDIAVIGVVFQFAWLLEAGGNGSLFLWDPELCLIYLFNLPLWLMIIALIRISRVPTRNYKALLLLYLQSGIIVFFILLLICSIVDADIRNLKFTILTSLSGSLLLYAVRIFDFKVLSDFGFKGHIHRNIILIADDTSVPYTDLFLSGKKLSYRVVVIFTDSEQMKERYETATLLLPEKYIGILNDLIEVDMIDEVIYLKNKVVASEIRAVVRSCEEKGVTFRLRHDDPVSTLSTATVTDIAKGTFLSFVNVPYNSFTLAIRKTLDINMAILIFVALLPLLALISLLIKVSSYGPVLCRRTETGWHGRPFNIFKFRTLKLIPGKGATCADSQSSTDYQVSWIGKFLRRSSLDELPQLLNVIRGEMSIIGHHYKTWQK